MTQDAGKEEMDSWDAPIKASYLDEISNTYEDELEFERERACGGVDIDCWDYVLKQEAKGVHYLVSINKWYTSGCTSDDDDGDDV